MPAPDGASADTPVKVTLHMGAGTLKLQGGADGLAAGTIDYNVPAWKPTVSTDNDRLLIEQTLSQDQAPNYWLAGKDNSIVNTWDLKLGATPMNLNIAAGAYKGELDLSGLHLRHLTVSDGASDSQLTFKSANPEVLEVFSYETGASSIKLSGLGYANFKELNFKAGVGDYKLDFAGDLQRDATVNIDAGMSTVRVTIPSGTKAQVEISGGMKNVTTEGTWTAHDDTYLTTGTSDYTLTIKINIGLGSLTLTTKTIFMRSEPMSAIFVKMPPAIRRAAAPSDSPMAKPMKHGPGVVAGDEEQDAQHQEQLDADEEHPDAHARP